MKNNQIKTISYLSNWRRKVAYFLLSTTCLTSLLPLNSGQKPSPDNYPGRTILTQKYLDENCVPAFSGNDLPDPQSAFEKKLRAYAANKNILLCNDESVSPYTPVFDPTTGVIKFSNWSESNLWFEQIRGAIYAQLDAATKPTAPLSTEDTLRREVFLQSLALAQTLDTAHENENPENLISNIQMLYPKAWSIYTSARKSQPDRTHAVLLTAEFLMYSNQITEPIVNATLQKAYTDRKNSNAGTMVLTNPLDVTTLVDNALKTTDIKKRINILPPVLAAIDQIVPGTKSGLQALSPHGQDYLTDAEREIAFSKNRLGFLQAIRATEGNKTQFTQHLFRIDISSQYNNCARSDDRPDQVAADAYLIWQNLQDIKKGIFLGPMILRETDKLGGFYCLKDMQGQDGFVTPGFAVSNIRKSDNLSLERIKTTQVHEAVHMLQDKNGMLRLAQDWSIYDFQINLLALEAAAKTAEALVEIDLSADEKEEVSTPETRKASREAFNTATANGLDYRQALKAAGAHGWHATFRNRDWADYYNTSILDQFIGHVGSGFMRAPVDNGYTVDIARRNGVINADFNFLETLERLPSISYLFSGNIQMGQIFSAVHVWHLEKTLGKNAPQARNAREIEELIGNHFIDVDLDEIYKKLKHKDNTKPAQLLILEAAAVLQKSAPAPVVVGTVIRGNATANPPKQAK